VGADHTFGGVLDVGLLPAAVLLPVAGVLLVTSEWSQRTGLVTFALVPVRRRVLVAKALASLVLAVVVFAVSVAIVAVGVLVARAGVAGTWTDAGVLVAQSGVYLTTGIVIGVAFGMVLLASAPAIVALLALPSAWSALLSLRVLSDVAPWLDTGRALDPLKHEVLSATQWAQAGTALALWMVLPLLLGAWRIARRRGRRLTAREATQTMSRPARLARYSAASAAASSA
jgi:hypothetical protein